MNSPIQTSVFEIFKIGLGPSSSHTTGPMIAAADFRRHLAGGQVPGHVARIIVQLHGSLGATGRGHATDRAVIAGLMGQLPADTSSEQLEQIVQQVCDRRELILGEQAIAFDPAHDIQWLANGRDLPHPNTLDIIASDGEGIELLRCRYLSVGGGFVELLASDGTRTIVGGRRAATGKPRYLFTNAADLREIGLDWWQIALANEVALSGQSESEIFDELAVIWSAMRECIARGLKTEGVLPGGLNVKRRAPAAWRAAKGEAGTQRLLRDPLELLAHAYALAVNEENAAGHKVVTAPTNGAAGVLPAALAALQDTREIDEKTIYRGLLTAGLIAAVIKARASLSGAEMGCQGEVGAAAAMTGGALVAMAGGTPAQVEMAAEISIEHHLGMTCDPIGGLVQIPCIERNVMGAVKALNAATLALGSDGHHQISLDAAIEAMRQIGCDMHTNYKETSLGGLALIVLHGNPKVKC